MSHLRINPNLFNFLLISLSLILNFQPLLAVRPLFFDVVHGTPTPPQTLLLSQTMLQSLRSDDPPENSTPSGCNHANNGGKPCPPLPPLDTRNFAVHAAPSLMTSSQTAGFQDLRGAPVSSGPSGCNHSNNGGKPCPPIQLGSKKNTGAGHHVHGAPNESFHQILIQSLRSDIGPPVASGPSGCTHTPGEPGMPCPPLGSKNFAGVVSL
ncbi:hypothetical protein Sjap_006269 [Stephania japonica]|uniref:Uncharacterized protein n=1 Tax=Stephania japonica TaxID=461633 RepID=A0AAP0PMM6_9MAGN